MDFETKSLIYMELFILQDKSALGAEAAGKGLARARYANCRGLVEGSRSGHHPS